MKFVWYVGVICSWIILPAITNAQSLANFHGQVVNSNSEPLAGAHILVPQLNKHAVSNEQGQFDLPVPAGSTIQFTISHISYQTLHKAIDLDSLRSRELTFQLRSKRYESPTVVVTATRSRRDIEDVPEPVTVISDKEIQTTGSTRLSEILAEQTGLTLTSNHGTGIQVQGFSSEYTKIMIDGQPLIGRTAGTFNLDRVTVGNVKQVEMIKGPSSALWGSDALAGVINIITEKGRQPFELGIDTRYGTNQTLDLGLNLSAQTDRWENNLFINRNSSEGYSLVPGAISQTVPAYHNYTASYQSSWEASEVFEIEFRGRYYREEQSSTDFLGSAQSPTMLDGNALQEDYSLTPTLHFSWGKGFRAELSNYYSRYRTDTRYHYEQGDSLYEQSKFDQLLNKTEAQLSKSWNADHITTVGGGFKYERLQAKRYPSQPAFNSYFGLFQHEWTPGPKWDVIAGFRYDAHSEYSSQFSPKLSAQYKLSDWIHLRASAGSGFKAPDFRQLFLDFTNPTVGYTVFGSNSVKERVQELQEQGQIEQILMPLDQLSEIRAEQSWAYNAGFDLFPTDRLTIRINGFRNNVDNLIESAPVATKTNGQSIFTYFNLQEVYTQGIETQLRWQPTNQLEISAGYQLLDARRKVSEKRDIVNDQGEVVEKKFSSYEPMFNRSRHSANVKLFYNWEAPAIDANLRGRWHGRYGRIDANGNGYVDAGEYEDDYMVWDASLAKTFKERYTLRLGIDNMFDFTRAGDLSYLSGRIFYAKLSLQLY